MLIMSLAYAQRMNDNAWLASHYDTLRQWTGFLVQEALIPANQISTDDFAGSLVNQTNLAIKGIIGIGAMAEIANRTGNSADYANFSSIALSYIKQWQVQGIAHDATPPHTTLNYGSNDVRIRSTLKPYLSANIIVDLWLIVQPVRRQRTQFGIGTAECVRHAKRLLPNRFPTIRCAT